MSAENPPAQAAPPVVEGQAIVFGIPAMLPLLPPRFTIFADHNDWLRVNDGEKVYVIREGFGFIELLPIFKDDPDDFRIDDEAAGIIKLRKMAFTRELTESETARVIKEVYRVTGRTVDAEAVANVLAGEYALSHPVSAAAIAVEARMIIAQ